MQTGSPPSRKCLFTVQIPTALSQRALMTWALRIRSLRWKGPEREVFHCKSPDLPSPAGVQARMPITEHNVRVSEDSSGVTILKLELLIM